MNHGLSNSSHLDTGAGMLVFHASAYFRSFPNMIPKLLLNPTPDSLVFLNLRTHLLVGVERLFISLLHRGQHDAELLNGPSPGDPECARSSIYVHGGEFQVSGIRLSSLPQRA